MRLHCVLIILLLLSTTKQFAQNAQFIRYAIEFSAKKADYSRYVITDAKKHAFHGVLPLQQEDTINELIFAGLKKEWESPKQLLLKNYVEMKIQDWGKNKVYDSVANTLLFTDNNPYYFSEKTFYFDSLGRIRAMASAWQGEASGSFGNQNFIYRYEPKTNTITIEAGMTGTISTIQFDSTRSYPIRETMSTSKKSELRCFVYTYKKNCLHKVTETLEQNGKALTKKEYRYRFMK